MKSLTWPALAAGFVVLMIGTVLVFVAFDQASHSASDTIRPFLITMTPVWAVAIAAAVVVLAGLEGADGTESISARRAAG